MKHRKQTDFTPLTCRKCGASIDWNTFEALEGLCSPCFQDEHYGSRTMKDASF